MEQLRIVQDDQEIVVETGACAKCGNTSEPVVLVTGESVAHKWCEYCVDEYEETTGLIVECGVCNTLTTNYYEGIWDYEFVCLGCALVLHKEAERVSNSYGAAMTKLYDVIRAISDTRSATSTCDCCVTRVVNQLMEVRGVVETESLFRHHLLHDIETAMFGEDFQQ